MRTALALLVMISSGCGSVTTQMTRRMALSTLPAAPTTIGGAKGVRLQLSALAGEPTSVGSGGAVAFPTFQPDLGASVQLGEHSFLGGRLAIATLGLGVVPAQEGPPLPTSAGAFELGVGGGHQFTWSPLFGLSVAGELGVSGVTLTSLAPGPRLSDTHLELLPVGKAAVTIDASPGDFKLYAGASVGTITRNDGSSVRTEDCRTLPCTFTDTGTLGVGGVVMLGGGVRWQPAPMVALSLEGWVPLTESGARLPLMLALAVHVGDFVLRPRPRIVAPPPPQWVEPPPQLPPPQL